MKKIILLSGWKGSGKDTVANLLVSNYGFKRIAFADSLKDMVSELYNIPRSHFDHRELKDKPILSYPVKYSDKSSQKVIKIFYNELRDENGHPPTFFNRKLFWTPRTLCIFEGSTKRAVDPNFWVKNAINSINLDNDYVFSDTRFKSEIGVISDTVKTHKVITIRINRDRSIDSNDSSERELDSHKFDYHIDNFGDFSSLKEKVDSLIKLL